MDKIKLRKIMLKRRLDKSANEITQLSDQIIARLTQSSFFKYANSIGIYVDLNNEVQTRKLIEIALGQYQKVACPKIVEGQMKFYYINSLNDLEKGYYNICEPTTDTIATQLDLVIVPMIGFNKNKHRIGYGKGFYDVYLNNNSCTSIGIAFDFQCCDFKEDCFDKQLDYIFTESNII